jgi:hypothetical protein
MLSAHISSFLKFISAELEETSRGTISIHHFHNVQCGIANILSLLEYNNDVAEKADQLSRRASAYITQHDLISSNIRDGDASEDADRLRAAHEALASFRFALEQSKPNSRVRTLGLAWRAWPMDKLHFDRTDYSVVVKNKAPPPSPWKWEIYRAGRSSPVKQSSVYFHTMVTANRAGKAALKELLDKIL